MASCPVAVEDGLREDENLGGHMTMRNLHELTNTYMGV